MANMKMSKETEFKMMLNRICNHLSRESVLGVNYDEGDSKEYIFTFHGTNFGQIELIFSSDQIMRMGEEVFKGHLRAMRNAVIDAELRTTKRVLGGNWGHHER